MRRDLWVALPEEDPRFGEADLCAFLMCNVYGTRDAGQSFELFTYEVMYILGNMALDYGRSLQPRLTWR